MSLEIASSSFKASGPIPRRHTADGPDLSPPLTWKGIPEGMGSLVVVCEDPDAPAGTWVHWVYYNLPPHLKGLPEGVPTDPEPAMGGRQGINDFGRYGYGGPSPPPGKPHRYFFKVFALDSMLDLGPGADRTDIDRAMTGHILAEGELVGTYKR